jgi:hypothetical protein
VTASAPSPDLVLIPGGTDTPFVAPQNQEAEEHLLGALLLAGASGPEVSRRIVERVRETGLERDDFFFAQRNGPIFTAILALDTEGSPCDVLLVAEELRRTGTLGQVGGEMRLRELAGIAPAVGNAAHYARLVRDEARKRREFEFGHRLIQASRDGGLSSSTRLRVELKDLLDGPATKADHLEPLNLAELLAGEPPRIEWLWKGWLARGELALLVADPYVGKSLLALLLADAIRTEGELLGATCHGGRVGMFDLEMGLTDVHSRLREVGLTAESHEHLLYFHASCAPLDLTEPSGVAALKAAIERYELDFVVIDSLRRAAPGLEENDSASVAPFFAPLRALTADGRLTILVVHHARKRIGDNPTEAGQMVRGSGDFVAAVDTLFYLRGKGDQRFILETAKARRGRPPEPIMVRIEDEDGLRLVNEGEVATADDKVEGLLARIIEQLREAGGGPLERPVLALRVGVDGQNSTFTRALKLGWQRDVLAKTEPSKVGEKALYALASEVQT